MLDSILDLRMSRDRQPNLIEEKMRIGEIQLGMRENPFLIQVNSELIPTQEF
jgi:hypothetical protein